MSIDSGTTTGKWSNAELFPDKEDTMKNFKNEKGKIGYIILWLLGVPFGVLVLIFLVRSCV